MAKAVDEPETRQIERRLVAVLKKERWDAIGYAVLTVLCTPVFVVLISLPLMMMIALVLRTVHYDIGAKSFYTCINIFLGLMAIVVLRRSNLPENPRRFDVTWLAGVGALLLLLYVTYATSLLEETPRVFAIVYTVTGLLILALFGRAYVKIPIAREAGCEDLNRSFSLTLEIFGFVALAYGEILSGSWLWFPPDEDKIRVATWILCKLALEENWPLDSRSADRPILDLLFRLKYIQVKDDMLQLTCKGQGFVTAASQEEYAVE